jgi:glycosyltransferase involved in cell wall biosynthesis
LKQTHDDLELIVVDDNSSDSTQEMMRDISSTDRRVVFMSNPAAKGAPFSRNRAIEAASGKYVTGLDDDDYFGPDRLSNFLIAWTDYDAGGIVPAALYTNSVEIKKGVGYPTNKPAVATFAGLFKQNTIGNQVFAPKSHFVDAGLFDEALPAWQDLDMFMRILVKHGNAQLVDGASYFYDDEDRGDRISNKGDRVRVAREMIARKYERDDPELRRALFLQMFNGYYNIEPSSREIIQYLTNGASIFGANRLLKAKLKSSLKISR